MTFAGLGRRGMSPSSRRSVSRIFRRSTACQRCRSVGNGQSATVRLRKDAGTSAQGSSCLSPPFDCFGVTRTWAGSGATKDRVASMASTPPTDNRDIVMLLHMAISHGCLGSTVGYQLDGAPSGEGLLGSRRDALRGTGLDGSPILPDRRMATSISSPDARSASRCLLSRFRGIIKVWDPYQLIPRAYQLKLRPSL